MAAILTKRVYDAPAEGDGERILVDMLWPRGISKERAALAEWNRDVAPSTELRKWFGHDPERFEEFSARYREELASSPAAEAFAQACRERLGHGQNVTLLYAARDPACNHAIVLKGWLDNRIG